MATTVLPAVIDKLVTLCRANAAFTDINVYDGPSVSSAADLDLLIIGDDDDDNSDADAGEFRQDFAQLGALRKQEDGSVTCALISQDGSVDVKAKRDRATTLLAAVENILRADPSLGNTVIAAHLSGSRLRQQQTPQGVVVRWVFTVSYMARI